MTIDRSLVLSGNMTNKPNRLRGHAAADVTDEKHSSDNDRVRRCMIIRQGSGTS